MDNNSTAAEEILRYVYSNAEDFDSNAGIDNEDTHRVEIEKIIAEFEPKKPTVIERLVALFK